MLLLQKKKKTFLENALNVSMMAKRKRDDVAVSAIVLTNYGSFFLQKAVVRNAMFLEND